MACAKTDLYRFTVRTISNSVCIIIVLMLLP